MEWFKLVKSTLACVAMVALLGLFTGCESNLEKFRKEGVRLYNANQYDQSLATLKQALQEDQYDPVSNAFAGLIEYRADHLARAEYHFQVALNADPSSEEAKSGLTAALVKQGKGDIAMDALERAAKMAEKVDDPRWLKSGSKAPYTKDIEERLFIGKINDRIRIAHAYETLLGDYDNALIYYKKALEMKPNDQTTIAVWMSIATMAERAKNTPLAQEYLRLVYLKDPAVPGLTAAMTRNNLPISRVIGTPK